MFASLLLSACRSSVGGRSSHGRQVKSSQGTNSPVLLPSGTAQKVREGRPLESPGDVGENALGTVPPLS